MTICVCGRMKIDGAEKKAYASCTHCSGSCPPWPPEHETEQTAKDTICVGRTLETYDACCKVRKMTPPWASKSLLFRLSHAVCSTRFCFDSSHFSDVQLLVGGTEGVRSRVRCCILQILATDEKHRFSWTRVIKGWKGWTVLDSFWLSIYGITSRGKDVNSLQSCLTS